MDFISSNSEMGEIYIKTLLKPHNDIPSTRMMSWFRKGYRAWICCEWLKDFLIFTNRCLPKQPLGISLSDAAVFSYPKPIAEIVFGFFWSRVVVFPLLLTQALLFAWWIQLGWKHNRGADYPAMFGIFSLFPQPLWFVLCDQCDCQKRNNNAQITKESHNIKRTLESCILAICRFVDFRSQSLATSIATDEILGVGVHTTGCGQAWETLL